MKVTYLGYVESEAGARTDSEKTKAFKNWPIPKNVKEVRVYLGFSGYYRRLIKANVKIARPLLPGHRTSKTSKTKKKTTNQTPFIWTDTQQTAFDTPNEKLMKITVLAYTDYSQPFKLHMVANCTGLVAMLYQSKDRMDRILAYASRRLSLKPPETNYQKQVGTSLPHMGLNLEIA